MAIPDWLMHNFHLAIFGEIMCTACFHVHDKYISCALVVDFMPRAQSSFNLQNLRILLSNWFGWWKAVPTLRSLLSNYIRKVPIHTFVFHLCYALRARESSLGSFVFVQLQRALAKRELLIESFDKTELSPRTLRTHRLSFCFSKIKRFCPKGLFKNDVTPILTDFDPLSPPCYVLSLKICHLLHILSQSLYLLPPPPKRRDVIFNGPETQTVPSSDVPSSCVICDILLSLNNGLWPMTS